MRALCNQISILLQRELDRAETSGTYYLCLLGRLLKCAFIWKITPSYVRKLALLEVPTPALSTNLLTTQHISVRVWTILPKHMTWPFVFAASTDYTIAAETNDKPYIRHLLNLYTMHSLYALQWKLDHDLSVKPSRCTVAGLHLQCESKK